MNLWTYAAVSAAIVAFCAFLVWISPTSTQTALVIIGAVVGWWFRSPGEVTQAAVKTEHVTVQKEQI
jgi:hypothetical protein